MSTSLRIIAFWFLTQVSTLCWSAVPSNTAADASAIPAAGAAPLLDMASYQQLLKLQESLVTGEGLDAIFQALYGQVIAYPESSVLPVPAVTPFVSQNLVDYNESLTNGQEFDGLPLPQAIDSNNFDWEQFNQEFFASLAATTGAAAPDNLSSGSEPSVFDAYPLVSSGMSWDEYVQQYFNGFNPNFDGGGLDSALLGGNESHLPAWPGFDTGAIGINDYSATDPFYSGFKPTYGADFPNASGGFGGGFSAADFFASLTNDMGYTNTFIGSFALSGNVSGHNNTASGVEALFNNVSGSYNTANGSRALAANSIGHHNSATGGNALTANVSGSFNSANGFKSLFANTTGSYNTGFGARSLYSNSKGNFNTALGLSALLHNKTGNRNTALGTQSLAKLTHGNHNVAVGINAGINLKQGNENIYIANSGKTAESLTIRIGRPGYARTFIGGIRGRATGMPDSVPVVIDSNGQLGTVNSSARFKKEIKDMKEASHNLLKLRPVTYRYKQSNDNGENPIEYGLIAEEVAWVYPELVAHSADGQIETVQYHKLIPMLLNELQVQNKLLEKVRANEKSLADQLNEERLKNQQQALQLNELSQQVNAVRSQEKILETLQQRISLLESRQVVGFLP